MKKLKFSYQRNWLEENRGKYGNPIRQMEKFVQLYNIKLLKSDYTSITVEVEDENCEEEIDKIIGYIKEKFEIENPWKDINISGDIKGLEEFLEQRKESGYVAKVPVETAELAKVVQKKAEMEEKAKQPTTQEKPKTKFAFLEEDVEKDPEKKKTEEPQIIPEIRKTKEEKITGKILIENSPAMTDYLKELNQVLPMLCKMGTEQCVWSQNLLVSIDDGFGYSSFLKEIANLFGVYRLADKKESEDWVREMTITQKSFKEQKYEDWDRVIDYAKTCAKANAGLNKRVILSLDITEWQSELNTEKVQKYLYELNEYTSKIICVFKVPYMELPILQKLGEILCDIMSVKLIPIPAVSIENMVVYMKNRLKEFQCYVADGCDVYLEQLILREKSDDSFYGYKTLDKLVKQLIYSKALRNCESGECSSIITEEDMNAVLKDESNSENPYEALNKLIGIAQVKQQINEIVAQIKVHKELLQKGTEIDRPCIHMMFTGNPGTGKTTVARLLARILKEEGVLRKGLFFEVQGRSLCGRYVGETAPRTSAICRDAYGSVLFIDEAYSLARRENDRDYGKEAIQTLIAEMENHRDDFCVILAGYKEPMYELMEFNQGLKSRIPYEIEFPNYSRDELMQIFFLLMEGKFEYENELRETVKSFFDSIPDTVLSSEEFSNARMVRNLFERVWGKAAYRCALNGDEKITIQKVDFRYASEMTEFKGLIEEKGKRKIGFFMNKGSAKDDNT